MLDDGDFDCNYTSDFTSFMSSTSEIYETSQLYTMTSPRHSTEYFSSTVTTEISMETDTGSKYEPTDTTTQIDLTSSSLPPSTSTITTSNPPTTTSETGTYSDSTTFSTITSTIESTSEAIPMVNVTKATETETMPAAVSETTILSSTVTYSTEKTIDTTLGSSFFTDYPTAKSTTESTVTVDKIDGTTIDDKPSTVTVETTTEFSMPITITIASDKNVSTVEPRTSTGCLHKVCQNGGTCVSTPNGAKVKLTKAVTLLSSCFVTVSQNFVPNYVVTAA